jgi:hypothetical protein
MTCQAELVEARNTIVSNFFCLETKETKVQA